MSQCYYVYFMANVSHTVLYLGRTENPVKRVYEHRNKLAEGFTKQYNVTKLVYFEIHEDKEKAAKREWKMKKWRRQWKDELIQVHNPEWKDLYDGICQ